MKTVAQAYTVEDHPLTSSDLEAGLKDDLEVITCAHKLLNCLLEAGFRVLLQQ